MAGSRNFISPTAGVTLFELLVAVLLLAIASGMIYSALNLGIKFSEKGEKKLAAGAREYGLLDLLHSQVQCAFYDNRQGKIMISADHDILRLVTRKPLLFRKAGLVLAVYRYNADEQAVYYIEKKDFYNLDYDDQYVPDFNDMHLLTKDGMEIAFTYDDKADRVTLDYGDKKYEFYPRATGLEHAGNIND